MVLTELSGPWRSRLAAYLGLAGRRGPRTSRSARSARGTRGSPPGRWPSPASRPSSRVSSTATSHRRRNGRACSSSSCRRPSARPRVRSPRGSRDGRSPAAVGMAAQMLLWPQRPSSQLRGRLAARCCAALADLAEAAASPDRPDLSEPARRSARDAEGAQARGYLALPHRPTGPAGPQAAVGSTGRDELGAAVSSFDIAGREPAVLKVCRPEHEAAVAAGAVDALRAAAARLEGRGRASPTSHGSRRPARRLRTALLHRIPGAATAFADDQALGRAARAGLPDQDPLLRGGPDRGRRAGGATGAPGGQSRSRGAQGRPRPASSRAALATSMPARARSGSGTASAPPRGSRSPSTSPSARACSTGSGSCSARSR